MDIFARVLIAFIAGWVFGFLMTRSALKNKYAAPNDILKDEFQGSLRVAYDQDDPSHPAMGLEIDSLDYILTHDSINLTITKIGFPSTKRPVYLQSSKDKSA